MVIQRPLRRTGAELEASSDRGRPPRLVYSPAMSVLELLRAPTYTEMARTDPDAGARKRNA
jgi:hypothetical protein